MNVSRFEKFVTDRKGVVVDLGPAGVAHVTKRLRAVGDGDGLNARLSASTISSAITIAEPSEEIPSAFGTSRGPKAKRSIEITRELVQVWLTDSSAGSRRFEAFEDRVSRKGDGGVEQADAFYVGDVPYFIQPDPRAPDSEPLAFLNLGYFEDIGYLVEVADLPLDDGLVGVAGLAALSEGALGVLMGAWDNEGVIIASIENRL